MQNKIIIVANGAFNNNQFYTKILNEANIIICADGGANHLRTLKIVPHYVIGDMDSVDSDLLVYLQKNGKTKVIIDKNQEKTDLELAIELGQSLDPTKMVLLGAMGERMDHSLANLKSLCQIRPQIAACVLDENHKIFLVTGCVEIEGKKDDIVSVIPIGDVKGLTLRGFKWELDNKDVTCSWFGISNKMTGEKASVSLQSGKLWVVQCLERLYNSSI